MLWVILYAVVGIFIAFWMREDITDTGLFWVGLFWPLLVLLLAFMFFLDAIGFRIH